MIKKCFEVLIPIFMFSLLCSNPADSEGNTTIKNSSDHTVSCKIEAGSSVLHSFSLSSGSTKKVDINVSGGMSVLLTVQFSDGTKMAKFIYGGNSVTITNSGIS